MSDLTRPSWDLWFMRQAFVTAQRGSCRRLRVGALIVRDRDKRVISGGYNGAPRGMPDCLEVGCDLRKNLGGRDSCFRTLHAESNALDLAGRVDDEPHTMYVTVTPCRPCAMRIVQHGIARIVYHAYYESQGTKEVEAIFAGTDPDTLAFETARRRRPQTDELGRPNWYPQRRVKFDKLDVPAFSVEGAFVPSP